MKGISIAIETIVYIILAVTVLSILLFFFTSQAGPSRRDLDYQRIRNQYCGVYANQNPTCDQAKDAKLTDEITKIKDACKNLKICTTQPDHECILNCCIFCPKPIA
ncbi:MAG: hypothetical protein HY832_01425 [Candidatus Aenigmarchaeota archaeon]|nr:hypothetical protein [Candidatus Aenigmarchaeota archaeon]